MPFSQKDTDKAPILRLTVTADDSADTFQITAIDYFRNRQKLNDGDGFSVPFSGGAAAANSEAELGTVLPPPAIIRIGGTVQA